MSNSSLYAYRQEIFNFLRTVNIKFTPLSYILGKEYINKYGIGDIEKDPRNPYFQYLCGMYDHSTYPITIYSIEDKQEVLLTREFLETHPRSKAVYRVPNIEYSTLLAKYPQHIGIIHCIVYPAQDIDTVITAENLSLLAYDSSLLHPREVESLLICLTDFLNYVRKRWWVPEFSYENLYPIAFWMLLWESLPNVLLAQRIENIRTNSVHPFHIWEYLISNGLGDYSDIVTINQALWLYRNLPWILKNKGKEIALYELAENILKDHHVDLCGIELIQSLTDSTDLCRTTPYFRSIYLPSGKEDTVYTTDIMLDRIASAGYIPYYNADKKEDIKYNLAVTKDNLLNTKYIEIRRRAISTRYEDILIEFLYSTLIYRYAIGDMEYSIHFQDPVFKLWYKLSIRELLALLYYAIYTYIGDEPVYLPKYGICDLAYKRSRVSYNTIPEVFYLTGSPYITRAYVDIETTLDAIYIHDDIFVSHTEYLEFVRKQFINYYYELIRIDDGDALYREAMNTVYKEVLVDPNTFIELPKFHPHCTTYVEYMNTNATLSEIITNYKNSIVDIRESLNKLADSIIDILIPIDTYRDIVGINKYDKRIYDGLKNLFIQLCSYNITFLETEKRFYKDLSLPILLEHIESATIDGRRLYSIHDLDTVSSIYRYMNPLVYDASNISLIHMSTATNTREFYIDMSEVVKVDTPMNVQSTIVVSLDIDTIIAR